MENFFGEFYIDKGTEIYKEDLITLEDLLKNDVSGEYGVRFSDDNFFKYEVRFLKNGTLSICSFNSIKDVAAEYENKEIKYLDIEKRIHEGSVMKQKITITITKRNLKVAIWTDDILKLKSLKFLIEDFFEDRESKTGKYNKFITNKIQLYSSLLAGGIGGTGFAISNYNVIIFAGLILIISGLISYPDIKHKLFPLNSISLEERSNKQKEKENSSIKNFFKFGFNTIFWGMILYFITKFLGS